MRATQFARQLAERDATIAELQRELAELKSRPAVPAADTQPRLDFEGTVAGAGIDALDESVALEDEDDDLM
jgi:hypothetical protein